MIEPDETDPLVVCHTTQDLTTADHRRLHSSHCGTWTWPERFFRRHHIAYEWENTPWILSKEIFCSPQDDISFFLSTNEVSACNESYIQPVLDVCHGLTLEHLHNSELADPEDKVALLIDSRCHGSQILLRPSLGALSARELEQELRREVNHSIDTNNIQNTLEN